MADQNPQLPGTMMSDGPQGDPWDQAFASYRQALVDLNGDGVPDAVVPVGNRERQAVARRAMAGREPTLTPQEREGVARRALVSEQNNQAVEQGVGDAVLGQPVRAVNAMLKAYNDPSLATVTNAGVQAALMVPTTRGVTTAAKIGATGLGAAAASDLLGTDNANAQSQNRLRAPDTATLPGLSPEQNQEYNRLQKRLQQPFATGAERRSVEARISGLRTISDGFSTQRNQSGQQEYDSAVRRAELARDTILSERPKKFSETATGKVYDELGYFGPGVLAAGAGAMTRAGMQAFGVTGKLPLVGAPVAVGTATGALGANAPLGHELMFAPAANPERRAFETYARELPPDHPRKAEWTDYARGLPEANPSRKAASDEFYDPYKMAERMAIGAGEGMLGGLIGSEAVGIATGAARKLADGARGGVNAMLSVPSQIRRSGYTRELEDSAHRANLARAETGVGQAVMDGEAAMLAADARNQAIRSTPGPNITFEPFTVPRPDGTLAGRRQNALASPQPNVLAGNGGPTQVGPGAGGQLPPPNPRPQSQQTGEYRRVQPETSLAIQEGLLSGRSPQELIQQYGVSATQVNNIAKSTEQVLSAHGGDRAAALQYLNQYRALRDYLPAVAATGAGASALNPMLQQYYGD